MELKSLETEVMRALTEVIDPETGLNIMRMDLIHDIRGDDTRFRQPWCSVPLLLSAPWRIRWPTPSKKGLRPSQG